MGVNPAYALAPQTLLFDKAHDFIVTCHGYLREHSQLSKDYRTIGE